MCVHIFDSTGDHTIGIYKYPGIPLYFDTTLLHIIIKQNKTATIKNV